MSNGALLDSDNLTVPVTTPTYALQISNPGAEEIIAIRMDGRVFWKGREVETDDDFRAAMMELNKLLVANMRR